ncbi:MAG: hypothetical protein QXJ03_04690 [Desulfurococcus sp.]
MFRIARREFTKPRLSVSDSIYHEAVSKYPYKVVLGYQAFLTKKLR